MYESEMSSSAELSLSYWSSGYLEDTLLDQSFDYAVETYDYLEMRALAELIHETVGKHTLRSLQTRMKALAQPSYEYVYQLYNGEPIHASLGERLDTAHAATINLLKREVAYRTLLNEHPNFEKRNELTGFISELTVMALLNRNGQYAQYIAIPASRQQDSSTTISQGQLTGIDFTVYPITSPQLGLKLQVKTSGRTYKNYAPDILVVPIAELVSENEVITKEDAATGQHSLPQALINYEDGIATKQERQLVGRADLRLTRLLDWHKSIMRYDNQKTT